MRGGDGSAFGRPGSGGPGGSDGGAGADGLTSVLAGFGLGPGGGTPGSGSTAGVVATPALVLFAGPSLPLGSSS